MSQSPYDLSIVIVNYNGWNLLEPCINSINQTVKDLLYEIWVVDNGSTDESVIRLKDYYPHINIIENDKNLGYARANNQAIVQCKGHHILLLNNDTIIHANSIKLLIQTLEYHPDIAAVGPQLINGDNSIQPSCMHFPSYWGNIIGYLRAQCGGTTKFIPQTNRTMVEVDSVTGACMLIGRNALTQIGLLDEGFFMYAEETDWCYRAHQFGWRIGYVPAAKVTHFGGQTAQREMERFYVERRISRVRFKLKHYSYFSARWDTFWIRVNIWIHWLLYPSQHDYYTKIRLSFNRRINGLFNLN